MVQIEGEEREREGGGGGREKDDHFPLKGGMESIE
jgi:hypothetical protein